MLLNKLREGVRYDKSATAFVWTQSLILEFIISAIQVSYFASRSARALDSVSIGGCSLRLFFVFITHHSTYHCQLTLTTILLKWIKVFFCYSSGKFLHQNDQPYPLQTILGEKFRFHPYVPLRCSSASTVHVIILIVTIFERTRQLQTFLAKPIVFILLAFVSMTSRLCQRLQRLHHFDCPFQPTIRRSYSNVSFIPSHPVQQWQCSYILTASSLCKRFYLLISVYSPTSTLQLQACTLLSNLLTSCSFLRSPQTSFPATQIVFGSLARSTFVFFCDSSSQNSQIRSTLTALPSQLSTNFYI